ncbi:emp24/gp25L/p24 family protein [Candidatus Nitrosotenuis cloacae]|uniref:emp24/gp25L/p24 family protein n=1 Tax=Candidatus Nitrosotenuis cloacae TaxID=1603555 RepID=UPI0011DDCC46|nr:emp24/gp25L/p24 family protein [Candidatus Nitrosotenuis cloacae]
MVERKTNWRYFGPYLIGGGIFLAMLGVVIDFSDVWSIEQHYPPFDVTADSNSYVSFLLMHTEKLEIHILISGGNQKLIYYITDAKNVILIDKTPISNDQRFAFQPRYDGTYFLLFENEGGRPETKTVTITYAVTDASVLVPDHLRGFVILVLGFISVAGIGISLRNSFKKPERPGTKSEKPGGE